MTIVSGTAVTGAGFYNEGGSALLTWEMVEGDPDRYFLTQIATNTADTGAGFATGDGDLTLDGVWLYGNQARLGGGGLHQGGVITVVNSIFDQNQASENGGGFYNAAITATLAHNTFTATRPFQAAAFMMRPGPCWWKAASLSPTRPLMARRFLPK
ncbi:MAG: hypothetical protein M5U34_38190 [Chloroflexi bacterium]|nr:hypothetical protein [Chloroflexota bacterium]